METRPYIICHMMASLDGRIDCDMTEQIDDTNHYYAVGVPLGHGGQDHPGEALGPARLLLGDSAL